MTKVLSPPVLAQTEVASPPATLRVAMALSRIEGARLIKAVGAAALFPLLGMIATPDVTDLRLMWVGSVFLAFPLAASTLIGTNMATLRARRHDAEELFGATPAAPEARTLAHLLSGLWPAAASAAVAGVIMLITVARADHFARVDVAELAVGPVLVAGAGALGVMLARWGRTSLVGPAACLAIAFVELVLAAPSLLATGWRRLAFWVYQGDLPPELVPARLARWHLIYLLGLVAMAAVGALVAHGLDRRVVTAGVLALSVVGVSAAFLVEPPPASAWAARNDLLAHPSAHQVCEVRDGVHYCAYPAYRALIGHWAAPVAGVRRVVPAPSWPAVTVSQRVQALDRANVADSAVARVLPDLVRRRGSLVDDGDLHPPIAWNNTGLAELELALQAAARVVGLPLSPPTPGILCDAAGQGRALVALWLAAQATPRAGVTLRRVADTEIVDMGRPYLVLPDFGMPGGVAWGLTEVRRALELASMTTGTVPIPTTAATSTEEMVARLGLAATPPASPARGARRYPGPAPTLGPPCP